jgi:hypothetical protein
MKCPICQAKLLPVDGELFCLQCGNVVEPQPGTVNEAPTLEDTTDPLLQRAIVDAVHHEVHFRLPVAAANPTGSVASFSSMRSVLAPPRAALVGGAVAVTAVGPMPGTAGGLTAVGPVKTAAAVQQSAAVAVTAPKPTPSGVKIGATDQKVLQVLPQPQRQTAALRPGSAFAAWGIGLAVFALFVGANVALSGYYSTRVYPGVRVGTMALGGVPLESLREKLAAVPGSSGLTVQIGGAKYTISAKDLGGPDVNRLEREVKDVGRTTPLPLAGVIEALASKPVAVHYAVNEAGLNKVVTDLSNQVERRSSDAWPLIVNGQAFVIAEKQGLRLNRDAAMATLRDGMGSKTEVVLKPDEVKPVVVATAYKNDVQEAQARMALKLELKVKATSYVATPQQIGSWLVYEGPGKGVVVDGSQVAAYVAGLPGKFDRAVATKALIDAVGSNQAVGYVANTKKNVAAPSLPRVIGPVQLRSYTYCSQAEAAADDAALTQQAQQTLGSTGGWNLGGAIRFGRGSSNCDVMIRLVKPENMGVISPACGQQTSCQVGGDIAISLAAWQQPPSAWSAGPEAYRAEVINHEVGHWLGFEHASCTTKDAPVRILAQPTVIIPGCSPNWYAIAPELVGTKVLPGL